MPLAWPKTFPGLKQPGCVALFTDAARQKGTGEGAFLPIQTAGGPVLLWCGFT